MDQLADMIRWFASTEAWSGRNAIPARLWQHTQLSFVPLVAAMVLAVPAGVLSGHYRRGQAVGTLVSNVGRAIPTLGLLVFGVLVAIRVFDLGFGYWPTVFALFFLALQPLFANTYTAVRGVDPALVEAARGQGLSERRVVVDVELPVASPVILTAVRISAVQVIATAPLGALAGSGGLGRYILDGFQQFDYGEMLAGIVLVALYALVVERLLTAVEAVAVPGPLRRRAALADVAATGRAV